MDSPRKPFRFSVQAFEAASAKEWTDVAREAEALGYSALFTTDHYFGPGAIADASGHRPVDLAPIAACMAAAAATTTLRVGCRVFCVDYHHPVVLAKELATLDLLTDGRLEVGLGAGWVAAEYDGLGVPMEPAGVRIERLAQVADLLKQHWTGEPLDVDDTYVHATGFAGRPIPVQRPRPPILIGGGAPKVLRLAGAVADIVSINFNNAGGKLGATSVASSALEVTEQKVGWIREGAGARFGAIELEIGAYFVAVRDDYLGAAEAMADRFGVSVAEILDHPHALIGSAAAVCERLHMLRERFGISYVNVAQRHLAAFAPVVARLAGT